MQQCPFCGGKHEITYVEHSAGSNSSGALPEGAEFYQIIGPNPRGHTRYKWRRMGYRIRCSNQDCIAFRMARVYTKRQDALDAWNRRFKND